MAYRIWGPEKSKEDENRMIENVIFDVGNVLMGYDWEEYLKSYNFPEEKYEKIADATFRNPIWEEQDRALHEESWYVDKFVERISVKWYDGIRNACIFMTMRKPG